MRFQGWGSGAQGFGVGGWDNALRLIESMLFAELPRFLEPRSSAVGVLEAHVAFPNLTPARRLIQETLQLPEEVRLPLVQARCLFRVSAVAVCPRENLEQVRVRPLVLRV